MPLIFFFALPLMLLAIAFDRVEIILLCLCAEMSRASTQVSAYASRVEGGAASRRQRSRARHAEARGNARAETPYCKDAEASSAMLPYRVRMPATLVMLLCVICAPAERVAAPPPSARKCGYAMEALP